MVSYEDFVASKRVKTGVETGLYTVPQHASKHLRHFQTLVVEWALRQGKAAVFADTGLGKTRMILALCEALRPCRTIIVCPLCVIATFKAEARAMGLGEPTVVSGSTGAVLSAGGTYITNYEQLHNVAEGLRSGAFDAVLLDESSILKHMTSKTRRDLASWCRKVTARYCFTATPCPNDHAELLNHAEFLGVDTYDTALARYFKRDFSSGRDVLRPHARDDFVRWLLTWSLWAEAPNDMMAFPGADKGLLERETAAYALPQLLTTYTEATPDAPPKKRQRGVSGAALARRESVDPRCRACVNIIAASDPSVSWVVWASLNDESELVTSMIRASTGRKVVEVTGSQTPATKERLIDSFLNKECSVLVTKPEIAGWGVNMQYCCSRMVFLSSSDSYEKTYQAIRRCHRYGQPEESVQVHFVVADAMAAVRTNYERKVSQVKELRGWLISFQRNFGGVVAKVENRTGVKDASFFGGLVRVVQADCVVELGKLPLGSIDYCVCSPPFWNLYSYSSMPEDLSNCRDQDEFTRHVGHFARALFPAMRPGRLVTLHCMNIRRRGQLIDLRGLLTRCFEEAGFLLHGECTIFRDPVQALCRTKANNLRYANVVKDASIVAHALPDYLITLRRPVAQGEEHRPIAHDKEEISLDEWKQLAAPVWNVRHNDTVQTAKGHPTPLSMEIFDHCIRLYSMPGERVVNTFLGSGGSALVAARLGRAFLGIELNPVFFGATCKVLRKAEESSKEANDHHESHARAASPT